MARDTFKDTLVEMGLDSKAASIYLALLGARRMSVTDIAQSTGIKRATCYEHIDTLLAKDFVVRVPVGKRIAYTAVSPKKILADYKKRESVFAQKVEEMELLRDTSVQRPKVTYHEGRRSLQAIYEDLFSTTGDVESIFPPAQFFENFSEKDYKNFDASIQKHALKTRDLIVNDSGYRKISKIRAANKSGPSKRLPDWFKSNVDVLIFKDKVALMSLRDLSAIVIENQDIANLFKNLHAFVWKEL